MRHAAVRAASPRRFRIALLVLGAASSSLSACAFVGREAKLRYPPLQEGQAVAPAPPAPAPDAPAVAVVVTDGRPDPRNRVGNVRNGFGMVTASVTTADDVAGWIKGALESELQAHGLRVVPSAGGGASLAAQVAKVECDAFFEYGASVMLSTQLTTGGAAIHSGSYTGQGSAGTNWSATEESFSLSLSLALRDAARQIAADVKKALPAPKAPAPPSS